MLSPTLPGLRASPSHPFLLLRGSLDCGVLPTKAMATESEDEDAADGITALLREVAAGRQGAHEALFERVYTELHRRACDVMRRQPRGHTLQPTALVGEVYLRLFRGKPAAWADSSHFLLTASRAMRQLLVDHARRKSAAKREGRRVELPDEPLLAEYEDRSIDIEALQAALDRLARVDPAMARAVDLRFFGGVSVSETARLLEIPERTFQRRWELTRKWLFREIR